MKRRIAKIMAVLAAGILVSAIGGCGSNLPTTADDMTEGDQQKLTVSTDISTIGDESQITPD